MTNVAFTYGVGQRRPKAENSSSAQPRQEARWCSSCQTPHQCHLCHDGLTSNSDSPCRRCGY